MSSFILKRSENDLPETSKRCTALKNTFKNAHTAAACKQALLPYACAYIFDSRETSHNQWGSKSFHLHCNAGRMSSQWTSLFCTVLLYWHFKCCMAKETRSRLAWHTEIERLRVRSWPRYDSHKQQCSIMHNILPILQKVYVGITV